MAPALEDTINFDADCDNNAIIDASFSSTVTSVVLSSGYAGTVTLSNPLTISGAFTVTGGIFDAGSQTLTVSGTTTVNGGNLNLNSSTTSLVALTFSSGSLTLSSAKTDVSGGLTFSGSGIFNNNSGTLNFNGTSTVTLSCNSVIFNLVTFTHTLGVKTVSTNCDLPLGNNPNANLGGSIRILTTGVLSGTGILTTSGTLALSGSSTTMLKGFSGLVANSLTIGPPSAQANNVSVDLSTYSPVTLSGVFLINTPTNSFTTTFKAPAGTMTVGGNFTINGGTFNHNNGTIDLGTGSQTVSGSNTFYNLKKIISSTATLTFTAGTTQTILGTLTLQGTLVLQDQSGATLSVKSNSTGSQWNVNAASKVLSGLSVIDSNNTAIPLMICSNCIDSGNNTNWSFGGLTVSFSLKSPADGSHVTTSTPTYRWQKATLANRDIYSNELSSGPYNAYPAAVQLNNGDLLVAFRSGSAQVSTDGKIMLSRSIDGGVNWTTSIIYDDPTIDDRKSLGLTKLSDGTLLLPFFKYNGTATVGGYILKSTDNGATWSLITVQDPFVSPINIVTYGQIIELPDGMLYMPVYDNNSPGTRSLLLQSSDEGDTWSFKSFIANDGVKNFSETSVVRLSATDYVAIVRVSSQLYQTNSTDGADTWSTPVNIFDGLSPNIIVLQGGDLLLCLGDRTTVKGIRCHISTDNSTTWSSGTFIFTKSNVNDGGYPATIQFSNGKLFTVYYYMVNTNTASWIGSTQYEVINNQISLSLNPYYSRITKYELYVQHSDLTNQLHIDNVVPSVGYQQYSYLSDYTLYDEGDYLNLTPINYSVTLGENNWRLIAYDSEGNTSQESANFWLDSTSSESVTSTSSAPSCGDQTPGTKAPWFYGAIAQDSSSVLLYFTEADNPVNKYVLEYGTKSGDYPYGVQDMGVNSRGQMTFLVKSLSSNTTYYFRVRGGNGCATGSWSNEISAKTKGFVSFNQLDITKSELVPKAIEETPKIDNCQTYTVKSGDNLWLIANDLFGDGNKYKEIIEQNKSKYPSLENSNSISTGWELKINCTENNKQSIQGSTPAEASVGNGYNVKVKVVDTNKKPVEGAKVTLHSKVQEAVTNKEGIAEFKNVEQGEHKVVIAYNNYQGEQTVNLTGEVKEFDLKIEVKPKNIWLSPQMIGVILGFSLIVIILSTVIVKSKRA